MGILTMTGYMEVHPTFLYEALATLLIFIILIFIQRKRDFKGQIFFGYCALYAFVRAIIEGLRADSLMFLGFRISQVLSIVLFIVSVIILVYKKRKEGKIK
jgi:phosphatidylglycerol:prolipoprotein diacylglycerol transferase